MREIDILLMMDYLEDNWDALKEAQLQKLINSGEIDMKELQAWKLLYQQTGQLPEWVPSDRLRKNFYTMLGSWESQHGWNPRWNPGWNPGWNPWQQIIPWFRQNPAIRLSHIAAGIAILLSGMVMGFLLSPTQGYETRITRLSDEVRQMRETMVLTLLDQPSATQRLKAVSISTDLPQADARIYNALLRTLSEDTQVNVRLAALEALLRYGQDPIVRQGLLQSIPQQESPLVQIALAEAMVNLQETQAVDPLKTLLQHKNLNEVARQAIERSIQVLI